MVSAQTQPREPQERKEGRLMDALLNAACEWAASNPWRIAQVIVLCVTAPCWVERLLP